MGFEGDLCEGMGLCGAQEAFGQAGLPPEPHHKIVPKGDSPSLWKYGEGLLGPLHVPYWPFVEAYPTPEQPRRGLYVTGGPYQDCRME